jgi:exonuclease III/ribonuclease HI
MMTSQTLFFNQTFKVANLNVNGKFNYKIKDINKLIKDFSIHIFNIQETRMKRQDIIKIDNLFPNYTLYHLDAVGKNKKWGSILLIHNHIAAHITEQPKNLNNRTLILTIDLKNITNQLIDKKVHIISTYGPSGGTYENKNKYWETIEEEIIRIKDDNWILVGDCNVNTKKINKIPAFNNIIHVHGINTNTNPSSEQYTFYRNKSYSLLDYIIMSPYLAKWASSCEFHKSDYILSTDHILITSTLTLPVNNSIPIEQHNLKIEKFNFKKVTLESINQFQQIVTQKFIFQNTNNIESMEQNIHDTILYAAKELKWIHTTQTNKNEENWPNNILELKNNVRRLVKALHTLKYSKDLTETPKSILKLKHNLKKYQVDHELTVTTHKSILMGQVQTQLKSAKKATKKEIHKYQTKKISAMVDKARTNYKNAPKAFFKSLNINKNSNKANLSAVMDNNKKVKTNPEEVKQVVQNFYQNLYHSNPRENNIQAEALSKEIQVDDSYNISMNSIVEEIHTTELMKIIDALPTQKATPDNVPYELYKWAPKTVHNAILTLFNEILKQQYIPTKWKDSTTIPIFKSGSNLDVKNYRPIALAPALYKIFMTILQKRTQTILDQIKLIHPGQNGFKPGASTHDNIFQYINILQNAKNKQRPLYIAYIDIKKAYDSVEHWGIQQTLRHYKFNESYINLIQQIYKDNHTQIITPYGLTEGVNMQKGVKQGCPLSPIIFNIFLNPLLEKIEQTTTGYRMEAQTTRVLAYCDDLVLISETENDLHDMLSEVTQYFTHFNLEVGIDTDKTKTCATSNQPFAINPSINQVQIPILLKNESYKYLGVHINLDLDWTKQETILRSQLNRHLEYINNRCIPLSQLITIINQVIIPTTAYRMNCIPFSSKFINAYNYNIAHFLYKNMHLKGYNSINHLAKSLHNFGFNVLELKRLQVVSIARMISKMITSVQNPKVIKQIIYDLENNSNYTFTLANMLKEFNIKIKPTKYTHYSNPQIYTPLLNGYDRTTLPDKCSNSLWDQTVNFIKLDMGVNRHYIQDQKIVAFTDGSRTKDKVSAACVIEHNNTKTLISAAFNHIPSLNNYTAELIAILTTLRAIDPHSNTIIYSDSLSAITAIDNATNGKNKSPDHLLQEIRYILQTRNTLGSITEIKHVYSHLTDKRKGNEKRTTKMIKEYGENWQTIAAGNKIADQLALEQNNKINFPTINEFSPKLTLYINDKPIPLNTKEIVVNAIKDFNYSTRHTEPISKKVAEDVMKGKEYETQPTRNFLFKANSRKLLTQTRLKEIEENKYPISTRKEINIMCPLECGHIETQEHILVCSKNLKTSNRLRKNVVKTINSFRSRIKRKPLHHLPDIWEWNSETVVGELIISPSNKLSLCYGIAAPQILNMIMRLGVKGKYRNILLQKLIVQFAKHFQERWRTRCKTIFSDAKEQNSDSSDE